jgi:hypothetical protein
MFKQFSLGPILSPYVDRAVSQDPVRRTRWEQGVAMAAAALERPGSAYGAAQVFCGAGAGIVGGFALSGLPLLLQFVIGGLIALAVYWGVPTVWAAVGAYRARSLQWPEAMRQLAATRAQLVEDRAEAKKRFDENDQNWRKAFEDERAESNRLRGLLGATESERDELRVERDALQDEVERLTKEREFPGIDLRIPRFLWGEDGRNTMIQLPVTLTNRETEPISLQFRLGLIRPRQPILWLGRLLAPTPIEVIHQMVHPPVGIGGKRTETFDLQFWVATEYAKEVGTTIFVGGEPKLQLPRESFVLEIEDYVSGARREFPNAGTSF